MKDFFFSFCLFMCIDIYMIVFIYVTQRYLGLLYNGGLVYFLDIMQEEVIFFFIFRLFWGLYKVDLGVWEEFEVDWGNLREKAYD